MTGSPIDANVIVRFLVEDPKTVAARFKGVYRFFEKLESGAVQAFLPDLVLFHAYFVLTSYYSIPVAEAAEALARLVGFRGIHMAQKPIAVACLERLRVEPMDLVDAWLLAWCADQQCPSVFSFDAGLRKRGLKLLPVG